MKNMKKGMAAALISVMIFGTMTGCGRNADIGKDKAVDIALEDAGFSESEISRLVVSKDRDDGRVSYEVEFTGQNVEYDYEILASNGEIIKSSREEHNTQKTDPDNSGQTQAGQQNSDSQTQEGQQTDSAQAQNGQQDQAAQTQNGQHKGTQDSANVKITWEEAAKLALDRVPGAAEQDLRMELDYDDGYYKYEGDIIYDRVEYEFEIDAGTGTFLEWSEERH